MKKSDLLNRLDEAQQQWETFLAQIDPSRMDQPGVQGDWSIKDIVAHLTGWNRRLAEFFDHFHDDHEPDIRVWLEGVDRVREA